MARTSDTPGISRRTFLRKGVAGAGATAAVAATGQAVQAAEPAITIPPEFATSAAAAPRPLDFPMTGAEVFARACKEEGVAALFCCPGNYTVVHALAAAGVPAFGGRHEGSMAHAADAFIRITGEIAISSGTERERSVSGAAQSYPDYLVSHFGLSSE